MQTGREVVVCFLLFPAADNVRGFVYGPDLRKIAIEVFPEAPDCIALFPAVGQQRVVAALQQDVAAGRHLLCISGPAGSGKTLLLRDLRQSFRRGLVGMVEQPVPGRVLFDVAKSLQLGAEDDNEITLRRRLCHAAVNGN